MPIAPAQPIYVSTGRTCLSGLFNPPSGPAKVPVLFCGPWGWDEVAGYRVRKRWAEHLAAAGHPVLRFDLPAVGDSGGGPGDSDLVEAWIEAVVTMADRLATASGASAVCGLGLGLGGLLMRAAVERGAPIDRLALWAAPIAGKSFFREARAFARLQNRVAAEVDNPLLAEGWLDVGGFTLSASTITALKTLDPVGTGGLTRTLLLGRDGVAADAGLIERLEKAGVEVETATGAGWGTMVNDARLAALPVETIAAFDAWLAAVGPVRQAAAVPRLAAGDTACFEFGGKAISECAVAYELEFGRAFGVLTRADGEVDTGPMAIFFNAGNVRHIGPNRLWVEEARRWSAETGRPALRLDLEAIGEADGPEEKEVLFAADVGELYIAPFLDQVEAVLDSLAATEIASEFVLAGLCVGSYWAFQVAVRDERVVSIVLLNAGALSWDGDLLADRATRRARLAARRTMRSDWWRRLVHGEVDVGTFWPHLVSLAGRRFRSLPSTTRVAGARNRVGLVETGLDTLRERGTSVVLGFSAGEEMKEDLDEVGFSARVERWPQLTLIDLPGADHTLRSPAAQAAVHEIFDAEIARTRRSRPAQAGRQR